MTSRLIGTQFVQTFFGNGNGIRLDGLTQEGREQLEPWLADLADPANLPVVLPRTVGDALYWYVLTFSGQQLRSVAAEILGILGPSYTDFDGIPRPANESDPIDEAASVLTGGYAFRIQVLPSDRTTRDQVRDGLSVLRQLWSDRPALSTLIPRPTGRLLRDFEMALQAGLEEDSQVLLDELRRHGRLTASNLVFLGIHRLAALRHWSDVLNLPELDTLLQMRRPVGVSEDLRRAIYLDRLSVHERNNAPEEAIRTFKDDIAPRFSALMQVGPGEWSAETAKLLMLQAITSDPQLAALANDAVALVSSEGADRDYLLKLRTHVVSPAPAKPQERSRIDRAITDMEAGRFASAADGLRDSAPSRARAEILLRCAYETGTLELAGLASSALAALPDQDRAVILGQRWYRERWDALQAEAGSDRPEELPKDWAAWLRWVDQAPDNKLALRVAQEGAIQWSPDEVSRDPDRISELVGLLGRNRHGPSLDAVRLALPHILTWLRRSRDPTLRPVYEAVFWLVAYDSLHSDGDLEVLLDLLEDFLSMGAESDNYRDLVSALTDVWRSVDSPRYLDWALDALEILVTYPSKSDEKRSKFALDVLGSLAKWARRVDEHQWDLVRNLADDIGAGAQLEGIYAGATAGIPKRQPVDEGLTEAHPTIATVAVYSLTESVLLRVRKLIEKAMPGIKVDVCSDKVGTDRLRQLARQSDLFLMAPRSAKHAATDFIKANRNPDQPLRVASGSGSASLIREFLSYVATGG